MPLENMEIILTPLLLEWSKYSLDLDFGDFVDKNEDSFILDLLNN